MYSYGYSISDTFEAISDTSEAISNMVETLKVIGTISWIVLALALVANICATYQLIKVAKEKGHYTDGAGLLWFIGLCGTPFTLGLLVCALPDRGAAASRLAGASTDETEELPEV